MAMLKKAWVLIVGGILVVIAVLGVMYSFFSNIGLVIGVINEIAEKIWKCVGVISKYVSGISVVLVLCAVLDFFIDKCQRKIKRWFCGEEGKNNLTSKLKEAFKNNKDLLEKIPNYLYGTKTDSACLITGGWGCGKTHAADIICKHVETYKNVYKLNAHGIQSTNALDEQLLDAYLGQKNKWLLSAYGLYEKIAASMSIKSRLCKTPDDCMIIIDNIERIGSKINITELFGYFEDMLHGGVRVIFIANEAEIKCKEYWTIKEKTIGQTCYLTPEVKAVLGACKPPVGLEGSLFDEFKDVIEVRLKALGASADNITPRQMGNNLRLMKRCVDCFIQNIKTFKEFEPFIDVDPNPNGSQDDDESKTKERFRKTMLTIYCGLFFQKDVVSLLSDAPPSEGKGDNSTPDQANTRNRCVEVIVGGMWNILKNDPLGTKKNQAEKLYGLNLEADWVNDLVNDGLYSLPFATVMAHLMFEPIHDYQTKIKEFNRRWYSRHMKLTNVLTIFNYLNIIPCLITSDELKTKLNEALDELEQKSADLKALAKCGPIEVDAQVDWPQVCTFYKVLLWLGQNVWFDESKHEYLSNARGKLKSIAMEIITIGGMTIIDPSKYPNGSNQFAMVRQLDFFYEGKITDDESITIWGMLKNKGVVNNAGLLNHTSFILEGPMDSWPENEPAADKAHVSWPENTPEAGKAHVLEVLKKARHIDSNVTNFIDEAKKAQNKKPKVIETLEELDIKLKQLNKNHLVGATIHIEERLNITPEKCLKLFQNHVQELGGNYIFPRKGALRSESLN